MLITNSNPNTANYGSTEITNTVEIDNCVFVAAQGRSGSTLLLRLLNAINGYSICGENYGAIKKLYNFYQILIETYKAAPKDNNHLLSYQELLDRPQSSNTYSGFEFYNVYQLESLEKKLRELIIEMFNPQQNFKVWGFKEIRFGGESTKQYSGLKVELDFLKKLFPKAKFIFLTRNTNDLVKSAWWAKNPERSRSILEQQKNYFDTYSQKNPEFTFAVTYEDIINNTDNLKNMYQFLGETFNLQQYNQVLTRN